MGQSGSSKRPDLMEKQDKLETAHLPKQLSLCLLQGWCKRVNQPLQPLHLQFFVVLVLPRVIQDHTSLCQDLPSSCGPAGQPRATAMRGFSAIPLSLLGQSLSVPSQDSLWHWLRQPGRLYWVCSAPGRSVFLISPNLLSNKSKAQQGGLQQKLFIKAPGTKFIFPTKILSVFLEKHLCSEDTNILE